MTAGSDREDRLLLLHAALDGELDAAGAIEVERALADRSEVASRIRAARGASPGDPNACAARERAGSPARAPPRVDGDDEAATLSQSSLSSVRHVERPTWRAFAAAIAATIVVTIGLQRLISTSNAPDDATLAVVAGHMRAQISGQPVDVASSDRHTVKPWLARKLPVAAIVVDLAPEGFQLLGGRIDIVARRTRADARL